MNDLLCKLPIGIQTFEKLRKGDYLYVDKTELVWKIAYTSTPYFLSRPRRFGKSLLLSTFEAYFEGKKELFEGLAIEKLETEQEKHPVCIWIWMPRSTILRKDFMISSAVNSPYGKSNMAKE